LPQSEQHAAEMRGHRWFEVFVMRPARRIASDSYLAWEVMRTIVTTHPGLAATEATVPKPATHKDTRVVRGLDNTGPTTAPGCSNLQLEISFEAQRQLIALAEALARQAAREDDAVERLTERSRSRPDVPVEILPGGGAKEDTS